MTQIKGGYSSALDFIMRRELFGVKLGLENITKFLGKIGHPHNLFPSVHIAGTNGKGSCAAYIESILRQAGYRTGIFTSPHLVDYRERIRVNGRHIEKKFIIDFVGKYRGLISRNRITFFETCTALAFCYFAHKKVDIAVVETGLGGRLDATNALRPVLSIITDISFDHTNVLGDTLRKIAFEKAGIVKDGIPALVGVVKREPRAEIARACRRRKAPIFYLNHADFGRDGRPFRFDYDHNGLNIRRLEPSLHGNHQITNAALAVRAAQILSLSGFPVRKKHIREGLNKTVWPGRFQTITAAGKPTVILDVGHNPAGIKAMVDCFKELYPGRKADIVIGFVRNKDLRKSVGHIRPLVRRVEVVRLNTHRTAEPEEVASFFGKRTPLSISSSVAESSRKLVDSADPDDIIIVCGSHFAVGDFLANQRKIL
ncbi:MAG: bifunctional folylpolyglutamate synthase/dihydrofolate synthase [Candidatus Zixiibacteriota bacterium]|nr:MAG: bifunctional folylpolyglutamate synthase/dihydrofolate synthase [candidate division Zixibacteria bacterium]